MYIKNLSRKLGGFILGILLLSGLTLFSTGKVEAQGRHWGRGRIVRPYRLYRPFRPFGWGYGNRYWGYPYPGYEFGYYSHYVFKDGENAFNQGYRDGTKTGKDDGKKHKSFDPERSHYFHDAGFGNFAETYRDGFSRGYSDGYGPRG